MEGKSQIIVEIEDLHKTFRVGFWKKKVPVLRGVNLQIHENETFGLLGPNGAGKTTALKTLVGLVRPDAGQALLFDQPSHRTAIRQRIGFLPELPTVYVYLTGYEFLWLCGKFFRVPDRVLRGRISDLVQQVGLSSGAINKQIRTYSKGMMQRLGFAQALINDPELLLLDEPMSGLDPIGRHEIKNLILSLKAQGKTILFNSHILADAEAICDRIGILVAGRIIKQGRIEDMLAPLDNLYHMRVRNLNAVGQTNLKRISLRLLEKERGQIEATFNNLDTALKAVAIVRQSGGSLVELRTHRLSLEEIFVQLVEEENARIQFEEEEQESL